MSEVGREATEKRGQAMEDCAQKIEKILTDKYIDMSFKRMGCSPTGFSIGKRYSIPAAGLYIRLGYKHIGGIYSFHSCYSTFLVVIEFNAYLKKIIQRAMEVKVGESLNEEKFIIKLNEVITIADTQNDIFIKKKIKLRQNPIFQDPSLVAEDMEDTSIRVKIPESSCVVHLRIREEKLTNIVLRIPELSPNQLSQILKFIYSLKI